jgi:hypothetical protein
MMFEAAAREAKEKKPRKREVETISELKEKKVAE